MILDVPLISDDPFFVKLRAISLNGSNSVDPTQTTSVFFAFIVPHVLPVDDDWQAGMWGKYDSVSGLATATYTLAPLALSLVAGPYKIWAKVTGGVGIPIHIVGDLHVHGVLLS